MSKHTDIVAEILKYFGDLNPDEQVEVFKATQEALIKVRQEAAECHAAAAEKENYYAKNIREGNGIIAGSIGIIKTGTI